MMKIEDNERGQQTTNIRNDDENDKQGRMINEKGAERDRQQTRKMTNDKRKQTQIMYKDNESIVATKVLNS